MYLVLHVLLMMKVMMMLLIGAIIDLRGSRTDIQWWSGINTAAIPNDAEVGTNTVAAVDLLQISGEPRVLGMATFQRRRRRGDVASGVIPVCQRAPSSRAQTAATAAAGTAAAGTAATAAAANTTALAHRVFVQRRVEVPLEVPRAGEPFVARIALI